MKPKKPPSLKSGNINVYPNPVGNTLNVSIAQTQIKTLYYNIHIANSSGIVIKQVNGIPALSQLNVSNLLPGAYIIKVFDNNGNMVIGEAKFIKQ